MVNEIKNLEDLFITQGRELYNATLQEQKELSSIRDYVENDQLKSILNRQLYSSKDQSRYLHEALKELNVSPEGEKDDLCKTIFNKTKKLIERSKDPKVRDAAIISSIQHLNHHKISAFGSLNAFAKEIGKDKLANTFHKTLQEEKDIDSQLSSLAEMEINRKALLTKVY